MGKKSNISLFYHVKASGHPRRLRIAIRAMYRQRYAGHRFLRANLCMFISLRRRSSAKAHVALPRSRWKLFGLSRIVLELSFLEIQYKYIVRASQQERNDKTLNLEICDTGLNKIDTVLCMRSCYDILW